MFNQAEPVIGPYESRTAVCRDYDPLAAAVARQIVALVSIHLPQIHAEHVGSTSVPGCAGKGIVDLMIPIPDGEMDKVKELLDRLDQIEARASGQSEAKPDEAESESREEAQE